jgi:hypothetical protein
LTQTPLKGVYPYPGWWVQINIKRQIDGYIIIKRGTFIVVVGKTRIWAWWIGLEEKYYEGVIRSELTSTAS